MASLRKPPETLDFVILGAGVVAISTAALWIRAAGADAFDVALIRLALAAVVLSPRLRTTAAGVPTLVGGICLAAHFVMWIASLDHTTVAASTVLVTTTPIFLGLAGARLPGGSPLTPAGWVGLVLATLGGAAIASQLPSLVGGGLAIGAALMMGGYMTCARWARDPPDTFSAGSAVVAAMALGLVAFALELDALPPVRALGPLVGLTLVCQVVGHTLVVQSVTRLGATMTATAILLEPIIAAGLAWPLFGELPSRRELLGGALVLAGVATTVRAQAVPRHGHP